MLPARATWTDERLDDLSERELERVHEKLADAIRSTHADKVIVRTASEGSETAVTVVGLRSAPGLADDALDAAGDDDEVDLWLEIPRVAR